MSNATIDQLEVVQYDSNYATHNRTLTCYGFGGKNVCSNDYRTFKSFEVKGYSDAYPEQTSRHKIDLRLKGCEDWDNKVGLNQRNFGGVLRSLENRETEFSDTQNVVIDYIINRSPIHPMIAAMMPFPSREIVDTFGDEYDDSWIKQFLTYRENAMLDNSIKFSKFEDWFPYSRDLKLLNTDIDVREIWLQPGEYLGQNKEFQNIVKRGKYNIINIEAGKGVGKTQAVKTYCNDNRMNVRAPNSKVSLAVTNSEELGVDCHRRLTPAQQAEKVSISTCYNSLPYLGKTVEDFVWFVDEVVQGTMTLALEGVGLEEKRKRILNTFCWNLLWSKITFLAEADLTPEIANLWYSIYKDLYEEWSEKLEKQGQPVPYDPPNAVYIRVRRVSHAEGRAPWKLYTAKKGYYEKYILKRAIDDKAKLLVWVENKALIDETVTKLIAAGVNVQAVTSDTSTTPFVERFNQDAVAAIKEYDVEVLIHTTSIDSGISIKNESPFDEQIIMECVSSGEVSAQILAQIGGRIRDLKCPRTVFLREPSKTFGITRDWTTDTDALVRKAFAVSKDLSLLGDSQCFIYDFNQGDYIPDKTSRVYKLMEATYKLRAQRQWDINISLREQLTWDGVEYIEGDLEDLMPDLTPNSRSATSEEVKALCREIVEMEDLDSLPDQSAFPDTEEGREEYNKHAMKWRCQQFLDEKDAKSVVKVKYFLFGGYKKLKKAREMRKFLKSSEKANGEREIRELCNSWVESDRKRAADIQIVLHIAPFVKKALGYDDNHKVKIGDMISIDDWIALEDSVDTTVAQTIIRRRIPRFAAETGACQPKDMMGLLRSKLGIVLERKKGKGYRVSSLSRDISEDYKKGHPLFDWIIR